MKNIFFTVLLVSISLTAFSQDYMDEITRKTCECIENIEEGTESEQFKMKIGLCMLQAAEPHQKKLKKDHGINWDKIDTQGEKLGRIIGMKMAATCPDALLALAGKDDDEEESRKIDESFKNTFEGEVSSIDGEVFKVFSVTHENGNVSKFYWFTMAASNFTITNNYQLLLEEKVVITYRTEEMFDARIGEYRPFNIITRIDKID